MAKYRLFEKNPITNEWVDKEWVEGGGQQDVLRQVGVPGIWYFLVPESSFHPMRKGSRQMTVWEFADENGGVPAYEPEAVPSAADPDEDD